MSDDTPGDGRLEAVGPWALELTIALPVGWTVSPEPQHAFVCVPDETLEDEGLRPSIRVERQPAVSAWSELPRIARRSLEEMERSYERLELLWEREDPERLRVTRAYEFWVPELDRRVRQVQGLVSAGPLYVIHCTSPLAWAGDLEPVFREVVDSVEDVT